MSDFSLLSILIFWPIFGAVLVLLSDALHGVHLAKRVAFLVALCELLLCVPLYTGFDLSVATMQYSEFAPWIPEFGAHYSLGIDGISLAMVMLTCFTLFVVVIAGCKYVKTHVAQYLAAFLVSQSMMVGVFCAMDAVLFYVFWEGMLIPIYLCIGIWGGNNRTYAAIKFFIYTFIGSVFMLVALIYLYHQSGSFEIHSYYNLGLPASVQSWLFLAFFIAFAVKVPMWPFHTWLPDAHTEAPGCGSVVLAALMLKMGIYGFVRFSMPIVPVANQHYDGVMIALALIAIVYIGIVAIVQKDMKKLVAYSSIAHMGFAVLGCYMVYKIMAVTGEYSQAYMSMEGAVVQMMSHAFSTGGLFLAIGILQYKVGSRQIKDFGGVAKTMPVFSAFVLLFAMSNIGLPGTSGFVGEFMVILSAFQASFWVAFLAASTLVIAAVYTLWMVKRVFFGTVSNERVEGLVDISGFEILIFSLLAFAVLFVGLYPQWLLAMLHTSVGHLLMDSLQFSMS
jgi:NADH-quinone oxidoreductase subunit M